MTSDNANFWTGSFGEKMQSLTQSYKMLRKSFDNQSRNCPQPWTRILAVVWQLFGE